MDIVAVEPLAELPPDSWRENVAAVVMDAAGHVLLGLGTGPNGWWHFPQGGMGSSETPQEALRRELREEVGLSPADYRIITHYGGLRYRYRRNNDKSGRWRGQEQCYFLVLCHAQKPAVDCSHTDEFSALTWVPWRELTAELFAPFKRKVVEKVLAAFFPPHLAENELMPYLLGRLTPRRYLLTDKPLAVYPTDDRALFGGGKEEMANTLQQLARCLRQAHKAMAARGGRLLILLLGAEGSGRKQAVRRLASGLDALHLRAALAEVFTYGIPWELLQSLPSAGGISVVIARGTCSQDWLLRERWLMGQGIRVLKIYLHADAAATDGDLLQATDSALAPWYILPAERRWYRDYLVATLVAEAMEEPSFPVQSV